MLSKSRLFCAALVLFAVGVQAQSERVLVLPGTGSASSDRLLLFEPGTLVEDGVLQARAGAFLALASPDGRLFVLSNDEGAVWLTVARMSGGVLAEPKLLKEGTFTEAHITPDGRLLLMMMNTGLYAYDITSNSAALITAYDVGLNAKDFAVSHDSRWAYVLHPGDGRLLGVDLQNVSSTRAIAVPTDSWAVAVGPNGLLYVSANTQVIEIDASTGRTGMVSRKTIALTSGIKPDRAVFTPDGKRLIVLNRARPTVVAGAIYNLETGKLQAVTTTAFPLTKLIVPSNDFAYGIGEDSLLYVLTFADLTLRQPGFAFDSAVKSLAVSTEASRATSLYVVTQEGDTRTLTRVDLNTFRRAETAPIDSTGQAVYAAAAADPPISQLTAVNQTVKVAPGELIPPLVVRAIGINDRAVRNQSVTWSPGSGLTAISSMDTTNGLGYAQAVFATPQTEGVYNVTAAAGNQSVTFTITIATPSGEEPSDRVRIISGQGQVTKLAQPTGRPITVQVVDENGAPVSGAEVSWQLENVPFTEAWISSAGCTGSNTFKTCITDAEGKSGMSFIAAKVSSDPYSQFRITATAQKSGVEIGETVAYVTVLPSADSFVKEVLNPPMGTTLALRRGEPLAGAIRVRTKAGAIAAIPNVGITVSALASGSIVQCVGGTVLTNDAGVATCDIVALGNLGFTRLEIDIGGLIILQLGYNADVTPGPPGIIAKIDGDEQSGAPGTVLPKFLVAEVRDGAGNPLAGTEVAWQVIPAGSATLDSISSIADGSGRVSARVTLGSVPGQVTIRASAGNAVADFKAVVVVPIVAFTKDAGDNQSAEIGSAFGPLTVKVTGAGNSPLQNIPITFAVASGSATLSTANVTTGADGKASVTVTAGDTPGPVVITATAPDLAPVQFNIEVRKPGPVLTPASFLNGASFEQGVSSGAVTAIVSDGLISGVPAMPVGSCISGGVLLGPLPLTLASVEVQFSDRKAPIFAICRTAENRHQMNVQAPFELAPASLDVIVRTGTGTASQTETVVSGVQIFNAKPGIFQTASEGQTIAIAYRPDGSLVTPSNPALKGEVVRVYATGLGPVVPWVPTNQVGVPNQSTWFRPVVTVAGAGASGVTAEYAENMIGVFVVSFGIPTSVNAGNAQVRLDVVDNNLQTVTGGTVLLPVQ